MMYKFFTDKHGLIDESRDELRDEPLEGILAGEPRGEGIDEPRGGVRAGESRGERIENEGIDESREGVRAGDLGGKTEAFRVSVRRESRAGE